MSVGSKCTRRSLEAVANARRDISPAHVSSQRTAVKVLHDAFQACTNHFKRSNLFLSNDSSSDRPGEGLVHVGNQKLWGLAAWQTCSSLLRWPLLGY